MVLFNLCQKNTNVKLHIILMLKQFSLHLGEAGAARSFDILDLAIINEDPATTKTEIPVLHF